MDSVDVTQVDEVIKTPRITPSEYKGEKNRQVAFFIEGYQGEFKVTTKAKDITITTYQEHGVFVLEPSKVAKKFQIEVNLLEIKEKLVIPVELENKVIPKIVVKDMDEVPSGDYFVAYGPIEFTIEGVDYSNPKSAPMVTCKRGKLEFEDGVYKLEPGSSNDVDIIIEGGFDIEGAKFSRLVKGVIFQSKRRDTKTIFPRELGTWDDVKVLIEGIRLNTDDEEWTPDWLHYKPKVGDHIYVRLRALNVLNKYKFWYGIRDYKVTFGSKGYCQANGYLEPYATGPGDSQFYHTVTCNVTDVKNTYDEVIIDLRIRARGNKGYGNWNIDVSASITFKLQTDYNIEFVDWEPPIDFHLDKFKEYQNKFIEKSDVTTKPANKHKISNIKYGRTLKTNVKNGDLVINIEKINNDGVATFTIEPKKDGQIRNYIQGQIELKGKGNNPKTLDVVLCPSLKIGELPNLVVYVPVDNPKAHVSTHKIGPREGIWYNGMSFPVATVKEGSDVKVEFRINNQTSEREMVLTGGDEPINKVRLDGFWYNLPALMEVSYKLPKVITVEGEKDEKGVYILDKKDKNKQSLTVFCLDEDGSKDTLAFNIKRGSCKNAKLTFKGKDKFGRAKFDFSLPYNRVDNLEIELTCKDHPPVTIKVKYRIIRGISTTDDMYTYVKSTLPEGNKHTIQVKDVTLDAQLEANVLEGNINTQVVHDKNDVWELEVDKGTTDFSRISLEAEDNIPKVISVLYIDKPEDLPEEELPDENPDEGEQNPNEPNDQPDQKPDDPNQKPEEEVKPKKESFEIKSLATGKEVIGDKITLEVIKPDDVTKLTNFKVESLSTKVHITADKNGQVQVCTTNPDEGKEALVTMIKFTADGYYPKYVEVRWGELKDTKPDKPNKPDQGVDDEDLGNGGEDEEDNIPGVDPDEPNDQPDAGNPDNPDDNQNNNNGNAGTGGNTGNQPGGITPPTGPTEGLRPPATTKPVNLHKTTVSNLAIHLVDNIEDIKDVKVYGKRIGHYFSKIGEQDVIMFYIFGGSPGTADVVIKKTDDTEETFKVEFIYDGTIHYAVSSYEPNLDQEVYIDVNLIAGDGTVDDTKFLGAEDIYNPSSLSIKIDKSNPNTLICTANEPGVYHILLYKYGYTPVHVKPIIFSKDIVHLEYENNINYPGEEVTIKVKGTNPQNASLYLNKGYAMELEQDPNDPTIYTLKAKDGDTGDDVITVEMPGGYTADYDFEFKDPKLVKLTHNLSSSKGTKFWLSQNATVTIPKNAGITVKDLAYSNPTVKVIPVGEKQVILSATEVGECLVTVTKRGYKGELKVEWEDNQEPIVTIEDPKPTYKPDETINITVGGVDTDYSVSVYHKMLGVEGKVTDLENNKFEVSGSEAGTYVITVRGYCVADNATYFFVDPNKTDDASVPEDTEEPSTDESTTENTPTEEGQVTEPNTDTPKA